jgi:hypothetical protein
VIPRGLDNFFLMFFKVKKNEIQVIDLILNLNNIKKYNKNK